MQAVCLVAIFRTDVGNAGDVTRKVSILLAGDARSQADQLAEDRIEIDISLGTQALDLEVCDLRQPLSRR